MGSIACAGVVLVFVAWAFARRRTLRRWWRTKACPHPDCVGRLPANPLCVPGYDYVFEKEQCELCQGWVLYDKGITFGGSYRRIRGPNP